MISVFGSINMDLVVTVRSFPHPGETVFGPSFAMVPGGKGANQAVGCARLGVPTSMVGRVGADAFGPLLRAGLAQAGVDVQGVGTSPGPSGVALITISASAENTIVAVPGANGAVGPADLAALDLALDGARVLLLQLEVPLETVVAAAAAARARGVTVVLDPAPVPDALLPAALYTLADIITPNETETALLTGIAPQDADAARRAAALLLGRGVREVIIKRGARGAFWTDGAQELELPAFPVTAVDTVAAGDAFNAALASAIASGLPRPATLRWALAGGALAVTRSGAQGAMATRAELLRLVG